MEKAKFYVDYCFEAGSYEDGFGGNICERYWFEIELSAEEYEELYQVWFDNDSELNSWDSEWKDHDALYDKINDNAVYALNEMLKKNEPDFQNPVDVLWKISKETEDAF